MQNRKKYGNSRMHATFMQKKIAEIKYFHGQ